MLTHFSMRFLFTALLLSASLLRAHAADTSPALAHLTPDTLGAAYVDLAKVDLKAGADLLLPLFVPNLPPEHVDAERAHAIAAQQAVDELVKLGGRRLLVPLRVGDFPEGLVFILEVAEDSQASPVADWLKPRLEKMKADRVVGPDLLIPTEVAVVGKVVLGASTPEQLADLQKTSSEPPVNAAETLAALAGQHAGIVLWGELDSRRVTREMFPALPIPFAEIDGRLLADGVKTIGVSLTFPPEPTATIAIEAFDERTAKTLEQAASKALVMVQGLMIAELASGPPKHKADAADLLPVLPLLSPKLSGTTLSITFGDDPQEVALVKGMLPRALAGASQKANNTHRINQFKQIALGMHNYLSAKGSFPAPANYDKDGKPLLSWRVHILPFVEQSELYEQFHLDEPWDSEHNRKLIEKMPDIYADPDFAVRAAIKEKGATTYVVPTGPGLVFEEREGSKIEQIKDGTAYTILLVEVTPDRAVPWTKPEDWEVDLKDPYSGLKRSDRELIVAAYADGSVRMLFKLEPDKLRAQLTRAADDAAN